MSEQVYRATNLLGGAALRAFGIRTVASGVEHLPTSGPVLLAATHVSYPDFLMIGAAAREQKRFVRFMCRHDVWHLPVVRAAMDRMRHVPVDREAPAGAYVTARGLLREGGRRKKLRTIWLAEEIGSTDTAVAELKALLGHVFESPKPTGLVRRILETLPSDVVVLDPFAGSGTTGAVASALGRDAVLIDQNADAIEVMVKRMPGATVIHSPCGRPDPARPGPAGTAFTSSPNSA